MGQFSFAKLELNRKIRNFMFRKSISKGNKLNRKKFLYENYAYEINQPRIEVKYASKSLMILSNLFKLTNYAFF